MQKNENQNRGTRNTKKKIANKIKNTQKSMEFILKIKL